jgi:hypothetical protein
MDTARVDLQAWDEVVAEGRAFFDPQIGSIGCRRKPEPEPRKVFAERQEPPIAPDLDQARVGRRQPCVDLIGVDLA